MSYFTDSPYERLMREVPSGRGTSPAALPETHFCYGCAHYGGCCFALCHRKHNQETQNSNINQEEEK